MKEIEKLSRREQLSYKELETIFMGYYNDKISDEDMTYVLKLICKNGLTDSEIFDLTDIFIKSGETFIKNISFVDKHSTGGVGDKTTLIVVPILAALNVKVSKLSGKGLGYTGGTIDKLSSIGVKTNLSKKEFYDLIGKTNMVISSQTDNLCPLDKKVYALRDVTGTTKSIALIAVSIMSKKIASGALKILIDIKVGKGALIDNKKDALRLANLMIKIGKKYDREVKCMITRMDNPLGSNIGNKLEVLEVIDILKNGKNNNLRTLAIQMASIMYSMNKKCDIDVAKEKVLSVLDNGKAYDAFLNYVKNTGGFIPDEYNNYVEVRSNKNGYVKSINSLVIGSLSMTLGAGRVNKDDEIDYNAGIVICKNPGEYVKKGDILCKIYGNVSKIDNNDVLSAFKFSIFKPINKNIIIKVIE